MNTVQNIIENIDKHHDIFNYQVNTGLTGKFILQHSGVNGTTLTPRHLLSSPAKINPVITTNPIPRISSFRVTAEDGTIYVFGSSGSYGFNESLQMFPVYTSWWLASIVSADLQDSINFKYTSNVQNKWGYSEYLTVNDNFMGQMGGEVYLETNGQYRFSSPDYAQRMTSELYTVPVLDEILFSGGKVKFETRFSEDVQVVSQITVSRTDGVILCRFIPTISNFTTGSTVHKASVKVSEMLFQYGSTNPLTQKYTFEYYQSSYGFPSSGWVGSASQLSKDWGGFFNGNSGPLIPSNYEIPNWTGGDRAANPLYAMQGMLKKINFPTGGWTEFFYEGNKALQNVIVGTPGSDYAPGLRLRQQVSYTGPAQPAKTKTYTYSEGRIPIIPWLDYFGHKTYVPLLVWDFNNNAHPGVFRQRYISSELDPNLVSLVGLTILYPSVTEYEGTETDNTGKTEYTFSFNSPGMYESITNVPPTNWYIGNSIGDCPLFSDYDTYSYYGGTETFYPTKINYRPFETNYNTGKKMYKKSGTAYIPVYEETFLEGVYDQQEIPELLLGRFMYPVGRNDECLMDNFTSSPEHLGKFYYYDNNILTTGIRKLTKKTIRHYQDGEPLLTTTTDYDYSNLQHLQPTMISSTQSNGKIKVVRMKYPADYPNLTTTDPTTAGIKLLQSSNMHNIPVETSERIKNTPASAELMLQTMFTAYKPLARVPDKIFLEQSLTPTAGFTGSHVNAGAVIWPGSTQERISFNFYSQTKNLAEQQKKDDVKEVYLWGYRGMYPVAKVIGSDLVTVQNLVSQSLLDNNNFEESDENMRQELQKIRTGLQSTHAQVTTYTYSPFIGITSETDPRGITTYYEYDLMGRLIRILDKDQKIIKQLDYQYNVSQP